MINTRNQILQLSSEFFFVIILSKVGLWFKIKEKCIPILKEELWNSPQKIDYIYLKINGSDDQVVNSYFSIWLITITCDLLVSSLS